VSAAETVTAAPPPVTVSLGPATMHAGDAAAVLRTLPSSSVHCILTSPPYWQQRDYGHPGQIGLEAEAGAYLASLAEVFREAKRVLRRDGVLWVNLADKRDARRKRLLRLPFRLADLLEADGWLHRHTVIWRKTRHLPQKVTDRPKDDYEPILMLTKSRRYWFDAKAIADAYRTPPEKRVGSRPRAQSAEDQRRFGRFGPGEGVALCWSEDGPAPSAVWSIPAGGAVRGHAAQMPVALAERCISAGCPAGGVVLDPFGGSGTTAVAALNLARRAVLIELSPAYVALAADRIRRETPLFAAAPPPRHCRSCSKPLVGKRPQATVCSNACRQKVHRSRRDAPAGRQERAA
jgi:site-specific DNA-methyltransferase (adenine-specific)